MRRVVADFKSVVVLTFVYFEYKKTIIELFLVESDIKLALRRTFLVFLYTLSLCPIVLLPSFSSLHVTLFLSSSFSLPPLSLSILIFLPACFSSLYRLLFTLFLSLLPLTRTFSTSLSLLILFTPPSCF